jgi:hypothetical protein
LIYHFQNYYEKGYHLELDLMELKEAYRENKLSGKLKELVATFNENEDNNVTGQPHQNFKGMNLI